MGRGVAAGDWAGVTSAAGRFVARMSTALCGGVPGIAALTRATLAFNFL